MDADLLRDCLELVDRLRELRAARDIEEGSLILNTCDYYALDDLALALRARLAEPSDWREARGCAPSVTDTPPEQSQREARGAVSAPAPAPSEATYPCDYCGVLRTKAEGGMVFTACDECWKELLDPAPPTTDEIVAREPAMAHWLKRVLCRHEWVSDGGGAEPFVFVCSKCGETW